MKNIKTLLWIFLIVITSSCSKDSEIDNVDASENYYQDKEVEILFENDAVNGINVIFMGDAYLRADLKRDNGKYKYDALKSIEFLFNAHPFFEYKNHFNAYIIYAESSIENSSSGIVVNYPFGSTSASNLFTNPIISNYDAVDEYVLQVKGRHRNDNDLVLMAVNSQTGGTAYLGGNVAVFGTYGSNVLTAPTAAYPTMLHEVGHAFASLGDEYTIPNENSTYIPEGQANLDNTNDVNLIKWNHFIGLPGYSGVGAYEGGGYLEFGMWRPEINSIMRGNVGSYFNAPSREAIVKKIMALRGITYDFNAFLATDAGNQSNRYSNEINNGKTKRIQCGLAKNSHH